MNYSLKPLRINLQWRAILGFLLVKSLLITGLAIFYQFSQKKNLYQNLVHDLEIGQQKFSDHRKLLSYLAQNSNRAALISWAEPLLSPPDIQLPNPLGELQEPIRKVKANIHTYQEAFAKEISPTQEIQALNQKAISLEADLANLHAELKQAQMSFEKTNGLWVWILLGLLFTAAVVSSLMLSFFFSAGIRKVSKNLRAYVASGFKPDAIQYEKSSIPELQSLNRDVWRMQRTLEEKLNEEFQSKQKALDLAQQKARTLSGLSHEIRTPLNGINGMIHLMRSTPLNADQEEMLDIAEHSSDHLLDLINMILDYSKLEAGKIKLNRSSYHLHDELNKLLEMFRFRVREKSIRMKFDFPEEYQDKWILCDGLRLQQVLINLLGNAVKFTDEGYIKLKVEFLNLKGPDPLIYFEVRDTGIGMNHEQLDRLFQDFEQVHSESVQKSGGTGLGLVISKSLVDLMGGELHVESKEDLGSRFYFSFPLKETMAVEREKPQWNQVKLEEEGIWILLAEDNQINQRVAETMLQKMGYQVITVNNGVEALEAYQNTDVELIFMDIEMPEMNGFEAAEMIMQTEKFQRRPVPIVALTANMRDEIQNQMEGTAIQDVITKPFRPSEIKTKLELLLKDL
ncbi:ATP-binding protein [Croceimicrobium sp.]|uniref:ATP-binding protein n=1 Tax=Croceimicrobium sp. TaxID=2828340 RepID=UPI003BABA97A